MTRSSAIAVILSFLVLFIALKIIFHWSSPLDIFRGILIILFFGYFPSILAILVGNTLDNTDRFNPIFRVILSSIILIGLTATIILGIVIRNAPRDLPRLSPGAQSEISKAFERLPRGIFVFSCPKEMTLGISEKCKARIANEEFLSAFQQLLREGLDKDISERELRYVSPIMNVKLTSQKFLSWKAFDINPQEDGGNQPVIDQDFTSWEWDVTPQESGKKKLKFIVSVIIRIPGYQELLPKRYEENEIEVAVKHNPIFSSTNFVKHNWKYLVAIVFSSLIAFLIAKKLKIIGTSIKIGSIGDIDLKNNEGVINLLASSQNINSSFSKTSFVRKMVEGLPDSSKIMKDSLENLRQFIQYNPKLNNEQKEQAFDVVRRLIELYMEQDKPNIHGCVLTEMDKLKTIIRNGSSVEAGFKLVDQIASMLLKRL